ncbi:MAG TPA: ATP-binding protein [Candidatus Acidoferrales bacterium]|nr:ATP-binding protein [Candidatus Acidoferrales bacterium]
MTMHSRKTRIWLSFGGLLVALLLGAVFTLGSLDLPFEPRQWGEVVVLYALSTFIVAALLVFGLALARSLLRLWAERRAHKLGSRFKTKMVLGAMAISLLPVIFMFWVSYALLNRTLARWFPRPLEIAAEESYKLRNEMSKTEFERLSAIAAAAAKRVQTGDIPPFELNWSVDASWTLDPGGTVRSGINYEPGWESPASGLHRKGTEMRPRLLRSLASGPEIWEGAGKLYLAARAPLKEGSLVVARRLPDNFLKRYTEIEAQSRAYARQRQQYRAYKRQMLLALLLFTLLLLFAATWFAVFLSKQVTVPIQALAEATREVSSGNFGYQIQEQAQDELGALVRSFNRMTAQLDDSRRQIEEFTRSLQQAVQELERRRNLIEAILENIPTGVLSLDDSGAIVRTNPAVAKIFGDPARAAGTLEGLLGEEAAGGVKSLMRRSLRLGAASQELEITLPGRVLHAAVTVSSLGPRRSNPGFVLVVDDLTELLRAQKAAAWQEVAQRIAHEIKNPLTPIQLSAQRLSRYLDRRRAAAGAPAPEGELPRLVGECAGLIEREVAALESMVDEFSQFARFPTARLAPADTNEIVTGALAAFGGRLEGITVRTELTAGLPAVKADPELLRRVLVNLIDNAAEAMEGSARKELLLSTSLNGGGETVAIAVSDSGHGISPEDKDKLFLPHFSTKGRGTGLGLAIVGRIIAEHNGTIQVEDNFPVGARFVIQLPVVEVPAAPLPREA